MSGLMQILLLKVSAHITEQLGMAPGGEFREAFKEVNHTVKKLDHSLILFFFLILVSFFWMPEVFLFTQAGRVPFCKFHLGDRPIPVTFKRAIAALSLWQKARLAWGLCFLSDPIRYKFFLVTPYYIGTAVLNIKNYALISIGNKTSNQIKRII